MLSIHPPDDYLARKFRMFDDHEVHILYELYANASEIVVGFKDVAANLSNQCLKELIRRKMINGELAGELEDRLCKCLKEDTK